MHVVEGKCSAVHVTCGGTTGCGACEQQGVVSTEGVSCRRECAVRGAGPMSSTGVTGNRGDAGTRGAMLAPAPSPCSGQWGLEGTNEAGATPCLWSECGLLLTLERPIGGIACLCPSLPVGRSGELRPEGQLTSWIQLGLLPKTKHADTPGSCSSPAPHGGHRGRESGDGIPGRLVPSSTPSQPS